MGAIENKASLLKAMRAYGTGDLAPFLALVDDAIVWTTHAQESHYRFGGRHLGRAGVTAALSMIAADYAIDAYDVREAVAEGDVVWVTATVHLRPRKGEAALAVAVANRWQFRDGRIIACDEFFDTAGAMCQEGRLAPTAGAEVRAAIQ